jgi:hypothetical protein
MGKYKGEDGRRKEGSRSIKSEMDGFMSAEPLSEPIDRCSAAEPYSDLLKNGLKESLDLLTNMSKKINLFQPIQAELDEFNKSIAQLIALLSKKGDFGPVVLAIWTMHQVLQDDVVAYMETGLSAPLANSIKELQDELFELWPSEKYRNSD